MKVLFEITHPKHAHLFRRAIHRLINQGHKIKITARDKDVVIDLLDAWGLEYSCLSQHPGAGLVNLGKELIVRDYRLWKHARKFKPDLFVARVGPSAAHVGWMLRKPVIVFEDTEDGRLQQKISFPFATNVCTALHYEKNWGSKHLRYPSFDELAYLHPAEFTPDEEIVKRVG